MTTEVPVKIRVDGIDEAKASFRELGGVIAGAMALGGLAAFTKKGLDEFAKLQTASNELAAALHHQSAALIELAQASAKTSTFRTPEIAQAEKVLATYKLSEDQIKQLLPAMLNLAVRTGSTTTAARLLGMSFENGSKRLGMFGIQVDGHIGSQERLESIIKRTNAALGDQNQAAFDAMNPLAKMAKSFDEIGASLGKVVSPEVEKFAKFISDNQESLSKFAAFVGSHIEIIGLATISMGVAKAAPIIIKGLQGIRTEIMLNPYVALAAGLGLAAIALADFWSEASDKKVTDAVKETGDFTKKLVETAKYRVEELKHEYDTGLISIEVYKKLTAVKLAFLAAHGEAAPEEDSAIGGGLSDEQVAEIEREKEFQAKVQELTVKIKEESGERGESEVQRSLDKEYQEYQKSYRMLINAGDDYHSEAIEQLKNNYFAKVDEIRKKEFKKEEEETKRKNKEAEGIAKKEIKKKEEAQKKFEQVMLCGAKTSFLHIKMAYKEDKGEFDEMLQGKMLSSEQHSAAITKLNTDVYADYAATALDALSAVADATKANAQVKKRIAEGEAIISAGKAALGILENTGQFVKSFGPVAGIVIEGLELAGVIAEAVAQVQKIEGAKMAYGGIIRGGTPGVDSVPFTGMDGEIVYNPAHPNPALAAMISQNTTTSSSQTTHIYMAPIHVHGTANKQTADMMQDAVNRGITTALRKAQNSGKISANGLVVRS